MAANGVIQSVIGHIATVSFPADHPRVHDVLKTQSNPRAFLEVVSSANDTNSFFCLVLSPHARLARGMNIINTHEQLMIPVGPEIMGRAFDIFGNPHDGKGELKNRSSRPLFSEKLNDLTDTSTKVQRIETGIKAIDFFVPLLKGGKVGFVGGAGIGKTVLLTEMINRLVIISKKNANSVAIFSAVGERTREAQELYEKLDRGGVLGKTIIVLGQMGENPAIRFRTAYAGIALAEYFRDEQQKDVFFFMDNLYRFAQAGQELSTMMSTIPSEDGYQATLTSEMAAIQERIVSTSSASITSFFALFVPSDDMTDFAIRSAFPYLDTIVVLSREIFQEGRFPAIDLLESQSKALTPDIVGEKHYKTYIAVKKVLEQAANIERIVSLVGTSELSPENHRIYMRAKLMTNYVTQDLFISQAETGHQAEIVPFSETVDTMQAILEGAYDSVNPDDLMYIGSIKNLKKRETIKA